MTPSTNIEQFREALASARSVAILAGAGLSVASGISTYRGSGGTWNNQDPRKLGTPEAFQENPSLVWQFQHYRRDICLHAKPNPGHKALAALSIPSTRERILPTSKDRPPLLITQNFDALSPRALESLSPKFLSPAELKEAQERLIEMHGSTFRTMCTQCKHINFTYDSPLCPALEGITEKSFEEGPKDIPVGELPKCGGPGWNGSNRYGRCGGLLRPAITWFGEIPEKQGEIARALNWTDFLVVVGTSSLVYPAAGYAKTVKSRGGKIAVFNLERSAGDDDADYLFLGPCEQTLPEILGIDVHTLE